MRAPDVRRSAERRGRVAELAAAAFYAARGYAVLARRFKSAGGEVDIVARRGDTLAFVEVKLRRDLDEAIAAVRPAARRRIERAGRAFLALRPDVADCAVRYDVFAVAGWRVRRVADAWRAPPPR